MERQDLSGEGLQGSYEFASFPLWQKQDAQRLFRLDKYSSFAHMRLDMLRPRARYLTQTGVWTDVTQVSKLKSQTSNMRSTSQVPDQISDTGGPSIGPWPLYTNSLARRGKIRLKLQSTELRESQHSRNPVSFEYYEVTLDTTAIMKARQWNEAEFEINKKLKKTCYFFPTNRNFVIMTKIHYKKKLNATKSMKNLIQDQHWNTRMIKISKTRIKLFATACSMRYYRIAIDD